LLLEIDDDELDHDFEVVVIFVEDFFEVVFIMIGPATVVVLNCSNGLLFLSKGPDDEL
jgi:hypothetical protein